VPDDAINKLLRYQHLLLIVILAFVVRAAVRWYLGGADSWTNGYTFFFDLAQNIAAGKGISLDGGTVTAFRVPLYPAFVALVTMGHRDYLPVLLSQSLIGAATVWCAALIAQKLFNSTAAVIAAFLTAIYPYYVVHDTALQETSLYTFLTALSVLLLMRVRENGSILIAACAGLTLGTAVLTRANLAPFALVAPLWLLLPARPTVVPRRRRLLTCLLCAAALTLTVSPWLLRSYSLTGSATLSSQSGFFLWLGNNPRTFSHYPKESIDHSQVTALAALSSQDKAELQARRSNEASVDQWFRNKGIDYIRKHPLQTVANSFRKIVDAFGWLPSPRRSFWPNLAYSLSYAPIMILGLWGMWVGRMHWREHSVFYAQFILFAAVTGVFFGATSYRAYLDVYWIVFAAGVLAALGSKYFKNMREPHDDKPLQSLVTDGEVVSYCRGRFE
jgi:4-amino-4-deoxy-L-arabinose transferase-like glycosyltransferase